MLKWAGIILNGFLASSVYKHLNPIGRLIHITMNEFIFHDGMAHLHLQHITCFLFVFFIKNKSKQKQTGNRIFEDKTA